MASSASIYIGPFGNMASNWIFTVPLPQSVGTFSLSITPSRCPTGADHSFNQHVMVVMVGVLINNAHLSTHSQSSKSTATSPCQLKNRRVVLHTDYQSQKFKLAQHWLHAMFYEN